MSSTPLSFILAMLSIAVLHAFLPDHWLPFVLVGKAQKWSRTKIVTITALAGIGHVSVTTLLGVLVSLVGLETLKVAEDLSRLFSGVLLITFGAVYIFLDLRHHDSHVHHDEVNLSDRAAVLSLIGMLTFSPCIAVIPVFFAASPLGFSILLPLSLILTGVTVTGMVVMTVLAHAGFQRLKSSIIEKYEKTFFGIILILLGVAVLIFD